MLALPSSKSRSLWLWCSGGLDQIFPPPTEWSVQILLVPQGVRLYLPGSFWSLAPVAGHAPGRGSGVVTAIRAVEKWLPWLSLADHRCAQHIGRFLPSAVSPSPSPSPRGPGAPRARPRQGGRGLAAVPPPSPSRWHHRTALCALGRRRCWHTGWQCLSNAATGLEIAKHC